MPFVLNTRPMQEALRWYGEVRVDQDAAYLVNKKMRDVVIKTLQNTPAVPRAQISSELQEYYATKAYVATGKRAGQKMKHPRALYRPYPFARAIVAARLLRKGVSPRSLGGGEIDKKVEAMIQSRLSSGSYAKSGWIPAARAFGVSNGFNTTQWSVHGEGILATAQSAIAQISNDVVMPWDGGSRGYSEVFQALQDAFDDVASDTMDWADEMLQKGFEDVERHMR